VPAAAVIPAPIAYIKVVAVKTFVVELVFRTGSTKYQNSEMVPCLIFHVSGYGNVRGRIIGVFVRSRAFT
jgi:hypothetical protein